MIKYNKAKTLLVSDGDKIIFRTKKLQYRYLTELGFRYSGKAI